MKLKVRPSVLIISIGLVLALCYAVIENQATMVSTICVALVGALSKLVESEEASYNHETKDS